MFLFCTGGCRSGKSEFARRWAEEWGARRVYVASAYVEGDEEMIRRIERHQLERGKGWTTYEAAAGPWNDPERLAAEASSKGDVLLFDCLTLWTSLCLERGCEDAEIFSLAVRLAVAFRATGKPVVMVSNEVGMGLVPDNPLGRRFRDTVGLVNQRIAAEADEVVFMVSGLPLYVKGGGKQTNPWC